MATFTNELTSFIEQVVAGYYMVFLEEAQLAPVRCPVV